MNKKEYMKEIQKVKIAVWNKFDKQIDEATDFIDETGLKYEMHYDEGNWGSVGDGCFVIRVWDSRSSEYNKGISHLPKYSEVVKSSEGNK